MCAAIDFLAEDARGNAWEVSEPASPQYNFSPLCEAGSIFTSSSTSMGTLGSLLFPSHTLPLSYAVLRKTAARMQYSPSSVLWILQGRISCLLSTCSCTSTLCLSHWSMCHDGKQPSTANILLLVYHGLQILKDWMCLVALQVVSFESHVAFIPWPLCITSIILVIPLVYLTSAYMVLTVSQVLLLF